MSIWTKRLSSDRSDWIVTLSIASVICFLVGLLLILAGGVFVWFETWEQAAAYFMLGALSLSVGCLSVYRLRLVKRSQE